MRRTPAAGAEARERAAEDLEDMLASGALDAAMPVALLGDHGRLFERESLAAGTALLRQGESGDDLYVLAHGRLSVRVADADGTEREVDEIGPGGVVGEMALLTGQPRTATVVATVPSEVLRISRPLFEQIAAADPAAMHAFMRRILHRLRRSQVVRLLTDLFGTLDDRALRDIESRLEWVYVASGAQLFAEGDVGDDVYLVMNGRLRVVRTDESGGEVVLEEVGRGGAVGEVALLTGEPRAATVEAVRDSHLLRLSRAAFDQLLDRYPRALMQLARAAVWRLRESSNRRTARSSSFALVPAAPGVPVAELGRRLAATLERYGRTVVLDAHAVERTLAKPGVTAAAEGSVVNEALTAWLSAQEREHAVTLLVADGGWTPWTRRCIRQADRILVVARAEDDPQPKEIERELVALAPKRRIDLVLLHADTVSRPTRTLAWLERRDAIAHHHVRLGRDEDVARLGRRIGGHAVGLVLGGGGARGFAHIGALRAIAEAGISVDVMGGTSIGALIAAAAAAGTTLDEMYRLAQTFASPRKLLDRTLPIAALMVGAKVTALYREMFGNARIEDLWVPYFCVSSGLSRAVPVVHRHGEVWRAVRASTALPAIFPPLLGDDDEVHVDGGVMNNMPLDVMRTLCEGGTVIGVNPMPTHDRLRSYCFGPSLSGWQALMGRLRVFGSRVRAPSILGSVMRATEINSANRMRQPSFRALADVLIEPPVADFPILAFDRYPAIIEIGYRAAQEQLASWQARANASRATDAAAPPW